MKDVVGFGALNVDLFYEVDLFDRLNFTRSSSTC